MCLDSFLHTVLPVQMWIYSLLEYSGSVAIESVFHKQLTITLFISVQTGKNVLKLRVMLPLEGCLILLKVISMSSESELWIRLDRVNPAMPQSHMLHVPRTVSIVCLFAGIYLS